MDGWMDGHNSSGVVLVVRQIYQGLINLKI